MESLWQDMRYGIRMLLKKPGFTAVAVVALALGIGANTAIFSVVNAVLLRPLPFEEPDRLVMVWGTTPRIPKETASLPDFVDWRDQNQVFEGLTAIQFTNVNLTGGEDPERLIGARVTADFLQVLRVRPALGRGFLAEEDQPGGPKVAVITHALWQRRFGGDPGVLNQTVELNNEAHAVVGVLPAEFRMPSLSPSVLMPLARNPAEAGRRADFLTVLGRLKPGVTIEAAETEMKTIMSRLEQQYPESNSGWTVYLVPLHEEIVGKLRPALLVLLGAVGCVLLIACANVANLMLARAASRQKEIAIRAALGAGRGRLLRQMLLEGLPLSLLGGALGLLLAVWGTDLLIGLSPPGIPRLQETSVDAGVLGFTAALALVTGTLFGLAPGFLISKTNPNEALKEGGRESSGGGKHRLRGALVAAQMGLALVLLVGMGLMLRSFYRLQQVDPGFNPEGLLTARVALPPARYSDDHQVIGFYRQLAERASTLPGVQAATLANVLPVDGGGPFLSFEEQGAPEAPPEETPDANIRAVGPDYFRTMGIPLLRGRLLAAQDTEQAPRAIVINETMARRYWPDADPIGRRIAFDGADGDPAWREIVGIVADVKSEGLDSEEVPSVYAPHAQRPGLSMAVVLRTSGDPKALAPALRSEVQALDRNLPVYYVTTMDEIMASSVSAQRFGMFLLALFAGVALVLAAVGIYGVMSYSVAQRTHEIGVRMALGAGNAHVVWMVVREGMVLAGLGLVAGVLVAAVAGRFLTSMLFEVSPADPFAFAGAAALLAVAAFAACYVPARRATRVDPMVALRTE
jgi:putative ABC transport system permease protein